MSMVDMKRRSLLVLLSSIAFAAEPLRLHPDNPHYFLFRGKPAVLITSGEHYGAVLNRAFDFRKYLDTLAADRLNLTRVFTGLYREVPGESFRNREKHACTGRNRLRTAIPPYGTAEVRLVAVER